MEFVLSIDATQEELRGGILAVDGEIVRIANPLPKGIPNPFRFLNTDESSEQFATVLREAQHELQQFIAQPLPPHSSSVLIVEPAVYLALNVTLPFKDARVIKKIIRPEVQDVVPFDLDSFIVSPQVTGELGQNKYDVVVQLMPRDALQRVVEVSRELGFDPHAIGTPSSMLAALLQKIGPIADGVVVLVQEETVHFVAWVNGVVRLYKTTPRLFVKSAEVLWSEAQLFRRSVEQRYNATIDRVKVLTVGEISELPAPGGLPWEPFECAKLVGSELNGNFVSAVGAKAVAGLPPTQISGNLRIGEFAFLAHRRELLRAWRALRWYVVAFVAALLIVPSLVYFVRGHYLDNLQEQLHSQVTAVLGKSDIPSGSEVDYLVKENARLEKLLRDLGSPTAASPLESYLMLSGNLPSDLGAEVKRVTIKGPKIRIEGSAPDYSSVEAMERILKRNRRTYCRFKKETSQAAGGRRGYAFDLWICE